MRSTVQGLHDAHGDLAYLRPDVAKGELHELCLFLQDHGWAGVLCLREVVEAFGAEAPGSLGAAWAEVEAAKPGGWRIVMLIEHPSNQPSARWEAMAENHELGDREYDQAKGIGPVPVAALHALAAALRESVTRTVTDAVDRVGQSGPE